MASRQETVVEDVHSFLSLPIGAVALTSYNDAPVIEERPYQNECLDILEAERQNGGTRALVQMATGLGKTTVAAKDVERFLTTNPESRVLFLCHQNEILKQANERFQTVLGSTHTYGQYNGEHKTEGAVTCLFASFQTMSRHRESFKSDEFDYIVVDESHHGKAETYAPTLDYFNPKFLLGITATPDRVDLQNIRDIFGPEKYSKTLAQALAEDLLAKPDYRVILDNIEDSFLEQEDASIAELNRTIFVPKRDKEIARIIQEKTAAIENPRVIVFSPSIEHARRMAKLLPSAEPLHSLMKAKGERERVLHDFKAGKISTLLTVDLFNEGVDIADANVIVFLRSTGSETIFLQQLGRGLRKLPNKDSVLVLDFVANCDRLVMIEKLLHDTLSYKSGSRGSDRGGRERRDLDLYDLEFDSVDKEVADARELHIGSFEFTETTRKIMELIRHVQENRKPKRDYRTWTAEDSLNYYTELGRSLGHPPTANDLGAASKAGIGPSHATVLKPFDGSIQKLKMSAGLKTRGKGVEWTAEDSITYYQELTNKLGRPAIDGDIREASKRGEGPSPTLLLRDFDKKLSALREAAEVKSPDQRSWTDQDFVDAYTELSEKLGKPAEIDDLKAAYKVGEGPHYLSIYRRFGTLSNLRQLCGIEKPKPYTAWEKSEFVSYYRDICGTLGRIATQKDLDEHSRAGKGPSGRSILKLFGSMESLRSEVTDYHQD